MCALALALLTACGGGGGGGFPITATDPTSLATPKSKLALQPFAGCGEFKTYYAASLTRQLLEGWGPCWGCEVQPLDGAGVMGAPAASTDAAMGPESGVSLDVSGTNTQEEGVDEADLIEADGAGYFYLLRGQELLVVDAVPAEAMNIVARQTLDASGYPRGLYLDEANERLVVFMDLASPVYALFDAPTVQRYGTGLVFLDVSDPTAPAVTNTYWTEGWALDTRRIDDRVHLVSRFAFRLPPALANDSDFQGLLAAYYDARWGGNDTDAEALAKDIDAQVHTAVEQAEPADLLPAQQSSSEPAVAAIDCASVHHTSVEQSLGLMLITSLSTAGTDVQSLATVNNAWQMYASVDNLYLVQFSGGWWFDPAQTQQTAIYRFALDSGSAVPAGFGVVDGWTLNSYSFGEHDGFLRVATTESRFNPDGPWTTTNHLFVLGEQPGGDLGITGAVRSYGDTERIFSARFIGDRGFVVTFRQIDPLFAFDLSNPYAPTLAGEIEIPGFSTYIHPLGPDHLLTIGRSGTRNLQLQIFDVSNLALPTLTDAYVPEIADTDYVFSLAEYDPHAFTYYAPAALLSIPLQIGSPYAGQAFSGFLALDVSLDTGFTELSRIDHKVSDAGGSGCPPERTDETEVCASFAPVIYGWPLRSVVIADEARTVLYTLSDSTLKAGDLADLSVPLADLPLAE